jgi:hypothetical protein
MADLPSTTPSKGYRTSHLAWKSKLRRLSRPDVVAGEEGELADRVLHSLLPAGRGCEGDVERVGGCSCRWCALSPACSDGRGGGLDSWF